MAAANGQFLLIEADALARAGGWQAVAGAVLDDIGMARAIRAAGGRTGIADGSTLATCRMYASGPELWEGYRKSLWAAFGSPAGAVAVTAALAVVYVLPAAAAATGSRIGALGYLAAVIGRLSATRWGGRRVGRDRPSGLGSRPADAAGVVVGRPGAGLVAVEGPPGMSRLVVIGAGLGGLAAAARLAAAGHQVSVFDSAPTVGGKLGILERDGFTFDTGPSLLTLPGELTRLFDDTGGPADLPLTAVDPACAYVFADGTEMTFPHDPAAVPAALDEALGVGAGEAWRRLHDRSRRLWELVGEPVLRRPVSLPALARMSLRPTDLRAVAPWRTLDTLGRADVRRPANADVAQPLCHIFGIRSAPHPRRAVGDVVRRAGIRRLVCARRIAPHRRSRRGPVPRTRRRDPHRLPPSRRF